MDNPALKTFWVGYCYLDDRNFLRHYRDKIDATDALDAVARVRAIMVRDAMPMDRISDLDAQLCAKKKET